MNHDERRLHIAIWDWLQFALPADAVAVHPANGEYRTAKTGALLKRMGVVAGCPDLFVFWDGRAFAIEVKAPGGRISPTQEEMHARLIRAKIQVCIAYKMEAVEAFLRSVGMPLRATLGVRAA